MKERPILFSGPMVRAILDGRKSQTRRIVKGASGAFWDHGGWAPVIDGGRIVRWEGGDHVADAGAPRSACPYGKPGDRLWVREAFRSGAALDKVNPAGLKPACDPLDVPLLYLADDSDRDGHRIDNFGSRWGRYRHARFMPRWASRLTLEVTEVRVERLHAITDDDAKAEGVEAAPFCKAGRPPGMEHVEAFEDLWGAINGNRAAWVSNPWVWAVTFRRVP